MSDQVNMNELVEKVRQWGINKGLIGPEGKATFDGQLRKFDEEMTEFLDAYDIKDVDEMEDGMGDMTVVLILLSEICNMRFETCLQRAYNEIESRTGKMVDGVFVKDKQ